MKVKICGITSAEDIKIVNACKPDFAGFVMFFPKSKRNISPETAKSLIETLDKNVLSVAVTVSPTLEQVKTHMIAVLITFRFTVRLEKMCFQIHI